MYSYCKTMIWLQSIFKVHTTDSDNGDDDDKNAHYDHGNDDNNKNADIDDYGDDDDNSADNDSKISTGHLYI